MILVIFQGSIGPVYLLAKRQLGRFEEYLVLCIVNTHDQYITPVERQEYQLIVG